MGAQKALLEIDGVRLVDRALAAAAAFPTVLVASPEVASVVAPRANLHIVVNTAPDAGMQRSLALANDAVGERAAALAVLLVDTPLVDAALVGRVVAARGDADVAYPARDGRAGHPVVFGPRARALLAALPAGDTLRLLRDDPRLSRALLPVDDDAPFIDVDTPGALAALARALRARG
jgi:CTP:molybdopterin cytidylyltransferase MocA